MKVLGWTLVILTAIAIGFIIAGVWSANAAEPRWRQCGTASWYGSESGRTTASGQHFNPNGISAAHRTLPFGTIVTVTDMATGRSIRVPITDRGPAAWTGRVIDLSKGAAIALGMIGRGTARVCIQATPAAL